MPDLLSSGAKHSSPLSLVLGALQAESWEPPGKMTKCNVKRPTCAALTGRLLYVAGACIGAFEVPAVVITYRVGR